MSDPMPDEAILTAHCEDRSGLVAKISNWIFQHQGNILALDQHVDRITGRFFIRIHWSLKNFKLKKEQLESEFKKDLAEHLKIEFNIHLCETIPNMAIFVSKLGHCLWDLLGRYKSGVS